MILSPETTAPRSDGGSLLPILAVNFVGTLGYSIVIPFLVFLVTKWGGNALVYGLIGATYSAFQLIGAPILGQWSDRYGRRKILLLSQLGTLVSWLIFLSAFLLSPRPIGAVDSPLFGQFTITIPLIVLFFARAMDGLTGGNVSVANAYLADITDEVHRSVNFGRMAISGNLGFVLGPALAGLLGATVFGDVLPVLVALLISLVATVMIAFGLKEVRTCILDRDPDPTNLRKTFGQEQRECYSLAGGGKTSPRQLLRLPNVSRLLAVYFLVMLGFSFFYIAFPIHAVRGLSWSVAETGTFFAFLSLLMVFVQGPVLAQASKRTSDTVLVIGGSLILGGGFGLFVIGTKVAIYLAATCVALGNGLMWPSVMALLSKVAGDRYQGAVQGLASSSGAVASILGLILGGLSYEWMGAQVFLVSATIFVLTAIVSISFRGLMEPDATHR